MAQRISNTFAITKKMPEKIVMNTNLQWLKSLCTLIKEVDKTNDHDIVYTRSLQGQMTTKTKHLNRIQPRALRQGEVSGNQGDIFLF